MKPFDQLADMDQFFFYGQGDLETETQHDILLGLLQPKRSLYYDRQDGAGLEEYENEPNTVLLEVALRFDVVNWVAFRNGQVSDGEEESVDRRVATSQTVIGVESRRGELDVTVLYVPLADLAAPQTVEVPLGVSV